MISPKLYERWTEQAIECHDLKADCSKCSMKTIGWTKENHCKMEESVKWLLEHTGQPFRHVFRGKTRTHFLRTKYMNARGKIAHSFISLNDVTDEEAITRANDTPICYEIMKLVDDQNAKKFRFNKQTFNVLTIWERKNEA